MKFSIEGGLFVPALRATLSPALVAEYLSSIPGFHASPEATCSQSLELALTLILHHVSPAEEQVLSFGISFDSHSNWFVLLYIAIGFQMIEHNVNLMRLQASDS